jgi:hypothetical protein
MTTTIPLPPDATWVDEWRLGDDNKPFRFFNGTTHNVGGVTVSIYGERVGSGDITDLMLLVDADTAEIRDIGTVRELARRVMSLVDEIEA